MERKGSSDQITRDYLDSLLLEVRHMDAVMPDTACEIFGHKFAAPIATSALSHMHNVRENGMAEMARGAAMADMLVFSGMGAMAELESMTATGAKVIKIIKPYKDRESIYQKIRHAEECGAIGVGIDIDHAFSREGYDEIEGMEMRPMTTAELTDLVRSTKLPFVIKGVLSVYDAKRCLQAGVKGMMVSHHNGRLDYSLPPLMILPEIVKEAQGKATMFVDCSLQTGVDVLKALALGAHCCCFGRPLMGPLKEKGAEGVRDKMLEIQRDLRYAMAMTASPDVKSVDPGIVHGGYFSR